MSTESFNKTFECNDPKICKEIWNKVNTKVASKYWKELYDATVSMSEQEALEYLKNYGKVDKLKETI